MVSTSSNTPLAHRLDFLRECLSRAQQLKRVIGTSQILEDIISTYNGPIPDLDLPFPHDILLSIDDMGLPKHLCRQMKSKLTEKVFQSQKACVESYQRTCHDSPASVISSDYLNNLAKTFENFYNDHQIADFRAKISSSKATLAMINKGHTAVETKKPTFNSEYTPLLEKYFEHNAYPSRPDRILLATKSLMTERQIEVWFQNHRNRAKKEGTPLKRMSPHQPSPMKFLEKKADPFPIPLTRTPLSYQNDFDIPDSRNENTEASENYPSPIISSQPSKDSFPNLNPTPCTFPTPYRRTSQTSFVVPLPLEDTPRFPPPNWRRKPAVQSPSPLSIDMEEFIAMFASKLSIRRGAGMKSTKTRPWFSARVTILPPAPHPALIRVKVLPHPSAPPSLLRTIAPSCNTATNIGPNLTLSSVSQPPAKNTSKPRKMAPFPFRAPQKSPLPSTDNSSPVHQPFGSRTSSFASVSSSQSRSSSASIGSSPEPTTPPHSPTIDSHNTHKPGVQDSTAEISIDLFAGIIDSQYDFSQNLDYFLNEDVFVNKNFPTSTHNFPYLDPLFAAT